MRARKRWRLDGLRKDQEQAVDGNEEEVKTHQSAEKQEVGEHSGSETPAQSLHG